MLPCSDPLGIGTLEPEAIGWFRHAEIKHGRIAMFGFVGFLVQNSGIHWPWNLQGLNAPVLSHAEISAAGGPLDQWDALPSAAKLQMLFVIGMLEFWGESSYALNEAGQQHYVRGGKPGFYPSFKPIKDALGQPAFDLFDPFGLSKKATAEKKERGLLVELNNGRAAMLGTRAQPHSLIPFTLALSPSAPHPLSPTPTHTLTLSRHDKGLLLTSNGASNRMAAACRPIALCMTHRAWAAV